MSKLFTNFLKYKRNRKNLKIIKFEKGLLKQFPLIPMTNFAVLFPPENFKRKNSNFKKYHAFFFFFFDITIYLFKKACLHNLCMNHALLVCESLDRVL